VLGFVGDSSRTLGEVFESKVSSLLKLMMNFICNAQFDREGKICVFLTLADLVLSLGERTLPYLP
jgi:hypothetical protein